MTSSPAGPSGQRPAYSILICPDVQLLRQRTAELASSFPADSGQWQRHAFWGDEEPSSEFWKLLSLQGLFATRHCIVAHQSEQWNESVWKKISQMLARPSSHCWPIFWLEVPWKNGRPQVPACIARRKCVEFAEKKGWVWRNQGLTGRNMRSHVLARAAALGFTLPDAVVAEICERVPPDGLAIENELLKLRLLLADAEGNDAGRQSGLVAQDAFLKEGLDVFACIRLLEEGDLAGVLNILHQTRAVDGALFILSAMLEREVRTLWQLGVGEAVALPPYIESSKKSLARRISRQGLAQAMTEITSSVLAVKRGYLDDSQSLERTLASLSEIFRPAGR